MMKPRILFSGLTGMFLIPTLLVSLPFFCIGVYEGWKVWDQASSFTLAEGKVVDNAYIGHTDPEDSAKTDYAYHPQVTFYTETGQVETFTDRSGALPPKYDEGDTVQVLYNPEDPNEAQIKSWEMWFPPALFICIGFLPPMIVVGIFTGIKLFGRKSGSF